MTWAPFPLEPGSFRQPHLPLALQHAMPPDESFNDCAAMGAIEAKDKNNASHVATRPRPKRELYFVPSIPIGRKYTTLVRITYLPFRKLPVKRGECRTCMRARHGPGAHSSDSPPCCPSTRAAPPPRRMIKDSSFWPVVCHPTDWPASDARNRCASRQSAARPLAGRSPRCRTPAEEPKAGVAALETQWDSIRGKPGAAF